MKCFYIIFIAVMAWGRGHRKVAIDKNKARELKKLLWHGLNNIETKRVMIMSVYLEGKSIEKTTEALWVSNTTVWKTINRYIENPENFYKTRYKGRIETSERKSLKKEIQEYVEKKIENNENLDINEVLRTMNRKHNQEVTTYNGMRWILRRFFNYNYQKPFVTNNKQSEHAEKIIKGRLTKAILEIAISENDIDASAIKNKKTKNWAIFRY